MFLVGMGRKVERNFSFLSRFTYYVPGVADLFCLLFWLLIGALLGNGVSLAIGALLGADAAMEYGVLLSYPVMFVPPMVYAAVKSQKNGYTDRGVMLDSANFAPHGTLSCIAVVTVATLCFGYVADALTGLLPQMPENLKEILESMTTGTLWINFLCVSIFAPVCEEWLCRGMVLRGLLDHKVKPVWAIVISALFFAIIHLNPWQAVPAFLMGCLFGYVYFRTGSLKLTMLMHFVNNTFALVVSRIPALEDMEDWHDVFQGPDYWLMFASCLLVVLLSVLFFSKTRLARPEGNNDVVPPLFEA